MLQLILLLGLTGGQIQTQPVAQYQPCSWPNKCEQVQLSTITTCQWPKPCFDAQVAQVNGGISTCDFPKKCG